MKLEAIITADTSRLEKAYREAVSASRATARQMDEAFSESLRFRFDISSLRSQLGSLVDLVKGRVTAGFSGLSGIISRPFSSAAASIRQSNEIIKESVESVSSEIIESFGIDGDVANLFANELVKVRLSTLLLGGAAVGLVGGIGFLTISLAETGAELSSTAELTGLTTDQLQRYESAANVAGVKTDALTDAIKNLRDQAKEAEKGNVDAANSFRRLGIDAAAAAKDPAAAFEKFLDQLETIPGAQQRLAVTQKVLGSASDDTRKAILALTDANGELRDRVNELGVALDKQSVEELKQLDRNWNLLTERVSNFGKRAVLGTINFLEQLGLELAGDSEKLKQAGGASDELAKKQEQAAGAINQATDALKQQQTAVGDLAKQLTQLSPSEQFEKIQKQVSGRVLEIAVAAKDAKEAVQLFNQLMSPLSKFSGDVADQQRIKANLEAINKLIDPEKKKPRVDLSEFEQLTKQLRETNKDIEGFQKLSSREFKLRLELEGQRNFKNQLEEILKLRRSLGEPIAVAFPETTKGAEEELRKLNALKAAREALAKPRDTGDLFRSQGEAEFQSRGRALEAFAEVQKDLRSLGRDTVTQAGAEVGERYAEAMALAIREGRGDIVDAINFLTEDARKKARQSRDLDRAQTATSVAESGLELQRVRIQNELNQGVISEVQARKRQIDAEWGARDAILRGLEAERALALVRGDAAVAADLAIKIEKASALGREGVSERLRSVENTIANSIDSFVDTLVDGSASAGEALKDFAQGLVSDIARELQSSLVESLTGGASSSIGQFLGKSITGFLGGLFKAEGGPVTAGRPYIVGERGPEWFVPNASGQVMNARQTAQMMNQQPAGAVNNFYFQISAPDGRISRESQAQIASRTAAALGQASRRNG